MTTRSSEEILHNITQLFAELAEAQEEERKLTLDRIDYLNSELHKQKQKQRDIAHILLGE